MATKILDASVVAKWFLEEEGSDKAQAYLEGLGEGKYSILIPTLLFYELGNVLLNKRIKKEYVGDIMKYLQKLNLTRIDIGYDSFRKVFQNAQELGITFYDAAYVTLMQKGRDFEFVTADRKLYEKLRHKFSFITLL